MTNADDTKKPGRIYWTMDELAKKLGWSTQRTRRHCLRVGAAVKMGGRWYTSKGLMRRSPEMREVYDEMVAELPE